MADLEKLKKLIANKVPVSIDDVELAGADLTGVDLHDAKLFGAILHLFTFQTPIFIFVKHI